MIGIPCLFEAFFDVSRHTVAPGCGGGQNDTLSPNCAKELFLHPAKVGRSLHGHAMVTHAREMKQTSLSAAISVKIHRCVAWSITLGMWACLIWSKASKESTNPVKLCSCSLHVMKSLQAVITLRHNAEQLDQEQVGPYFVILVHRVVHLHE